MKTLKYIKFWIPIIGLLIAYNVVDHIENPILQRKFDQISEDKYYVEFKQQLGFQPTIINLFLFTLYHKIVTISVCLLLLVLGVISFGTISIN